MTSSIQSAHRERHTDAGQGSMDPRTFRDALGHYASGITIIAGHDGREPFGFTCQSFYSVSVAPPLISFSVMANSSSYPRIRETGKFSVNVLAESQQAISDQFARGGTDKWAGVVWKMTPGKNPVIAGTLIWLDCGIVAEHEAGDHFIVIGQVNAMSPSDWHNGAPLLYFKGKYRHLHAPDGSAK
ncbi:MAG: flavin reductase family protein [Xanthobacteraceae bacterium]|nr:flavin reductase family protein [Xanthobacteraceae bacterium]